MVVPWLANRTPVEIGRMARSDRFIRRFRIVGVALIVVVLAGSAMTQAASANDGAIVAVDLVNVRSEPGTWSEVTATLTGGEWLAIYDGPTEDGWYYIGAGDVTGWVYGPHLSIDGAPGWTDWGAAPVEDDWTGETAVGGVGQPWGTAYVAIDSINVRAWASTDAEMLGEIWYGQAVTITGAEQNGFVPVSYGDGQAWVWSDYLSVGAAPGPEHWIDVDRSSELVTLYEGDVQIATYWGALGFDLTDSGFYATANGTYYVYEKYGDLSWTTWGRAWVSDWVGFDPARLNGFHSFSLDSNGRMIPGGDGPTGGCIALAPWAADHVFSFLRIGSRVEVHW